MYIDADTIIKIGSVLTALAAIISVIIAIYKMFEVGKKQTEIIKSMQDENALICYGLKCVLQGVIELGADGPTQDALAKLDKHINRTAHKTDI